MSYVAPSGAKSSTEKPRYDLIYVGLLTRLAERMGYGAAKHGEMNFALGKGDAVYRRDRINHLIEHVFKYAAAQSDEERRTQLSAIVANANILAYLDDHA